MRDQQNNGIRWFSFSSLIIIVVWFTRDVALSVYVRDAPARRFIHFSRAFIAIKITTKTTILARTPTEISIFRSLWSLLFARQLVVCVDSILISFVGVSMSLPFRIYMENWSGDFHQFYSTALRIVQPQPLRPKSSSTQQQWQATHRNRTPNYM